CWSSRRTAACPCLSASMSLRSVAISSAVWAIANGAFSAIRIPATSTCLTMVPPRFLASGESVDGEPVPKRDFERNRRISLRATDSRIPWRALGTEARVRRRVFVDREAVPWALPLLYIHRVREPRAVGQSPGGRAHGRERNEGTCNEVDGGARGAPERVRA